VQRSIKRKNYLGTVIFDLIVNNGLNNRFFEIPFDGSVLNIRELKKASSLNTKVLETANEYYKNNIDLIQSCYISRIEKTRVINVITSSKMQTSF